MLGSNDQNIVSYRTRFVAPSIIDLSSYIGEITAGGIYVVSILESHGDDEGKEN